MEPVQTLDTRIAAKHLLDHPFYQRWNAGDLSREELQDYARQYYHYALAFPTFLSAMHHQTDDIAIRQMLLENLIEEERGAENHPELWLRFCDALGLSRADVLSTTASDATRRLIEAVRETARNGELHEGLAALYAYESQVPAVAQSKIDGLAKWYGITVERDIAFFSVHIEADVVHSGTSKSLLNQLCDTPAKTTAAAEATSRTLDALYGFLDSVTTMPALVH